MAGLICALRMTFGLGIEVEGADVLPSGPLVCLGRRASMGDALVSVWVFGSVAHRSPRYVMKKELAVDPCLERSLPPKPGGAEALVGRDGEPLDLGRTFTLDEERDEMAHFLSTCGYLVVRGVFEPHEIHAMNIVVARERATASPEDNRSRWATDVEGHEVCCRLTYLAQRDPVFGALVDDERLLGLARLAGVDLLPCPDRVDGMGVVIKNPAVTSGLSDLPWHRDCGMGGHFVLCPGLNMGIQLDRADVSYREPKGGLRRVPRSGPVRHRRTRRGLQRCAVRPWRRSCGRWPRLPIDVVVGSECPAPQSAAGRMRRVRSAAFRQRPVAQSKRQPWSVHTS